MASSDLERWLAGLDDFRGVLTLIGTCKNAGKTTVLNYLLSRFGGAGTGVTSLGRDGERRDALQGHAKPHIEVRAGCLFATARGALERSRGEWKLERTSQARTPLGEVVIARALGPSRVELAGPSTVSDLTGLRRDLIDLGARRILLDGAFDRVAGASAKLSSALVIAAGSAGAGGLEGAVREAYNYVRRYQLPVFAADRSRPPVLERRSLIGPELAEIQGDVLLPDPSCCLLDPLSWRWVERGEVRIFVRRQVPLLGVFVSSFRPGMNPLDARRLLAGVRDKCRPLPVFDLMLEGFLDGAQADAGSQADR